MSNTVPPTYQVERQGWFRWALYAMNKYSGRRVAVFWRKETAEKAAWELNRFEQERPEMKAREVAYDEQMLRLTVVQPTSTNMALSDMRSFQVRPLV